MAKKKTSSIGTLSSYWSPPANLPTGDVGNPLVCLASTFEFQASFFEAELLPRFLGLKYDHTENEKTFLVEREEMLAQVDAAVFVDIHKIDPGQTTLRWDQIPIAVPGSASIQHSKIVVLAWERAVRLIVGSANLVPSGYRRNREVFAAFDFFNHADSTPRRLAVDAIGLLEIILSWARVPIATQERIRTYFQGVKDKLLGWTAIPEDFRPREKPKVNFVATHPPVRDGAAASTIEQMASLWGPRSASEITVFTPFAGQSCAGEDAVVRRVASIPRTRDCVGWLVAPRLPADPADEVVRIPFPQTFGDTWRKSFDTRGGGRVLAIPSFVKGVDKVHRPFHSKLLALRTADQELLLIGSSNFTPHGMGLGVFNVEANLAFELSAEDGWAGIEVPIFWDNWRPVSDLQWEEPLDLAKDSIDQAAMLPLFFACASFSQVTGVLTVLLDREEKEPIHWAISLRGANSDELTIFLRSTSVPENELSHTFPEDSRAVCLSTVAVEWQDELGQLRQASLIVAIQHKDDLVAAHLFQGLGIDAMLDCLVHGRTLAEWQERMTISTSSRSGIPEALDSLRAIDTSGYLLYRVRQFGRAMSGLSDRMGRVALIPTAVRYRFFRDPLGPVSVAEALVCESTEAKGAFADMPHEQRLFLVTELLLSVSQAIRRLLMQADSKCETWLHELAGELLAKLSGLVTTLKDTGEAHTSDSMRMYVSNVLQEVSSLSSQLEKEANDAC